MGDSTGLSAVLRDWSGRGSHVDFGRDEVLPLKEGDPLGHGAQAHVYAQECRGVTVAVKRRIRRGRITAAERREMDILKKLSHIHVIQFVGTYIHRGIFGIIMYPVAVCDLATFFVAVQSLDPECVPNDDQAQKLTQLDLPLDFSDASRRKYTEFLYPRIGCLVTAMEYLHAHGIRHKDIKPANILLSPEQLWLTDFGCSTDFSDLPSSVTDNGRVGTRPYFAPEVAECLPNGRASDIFSLGCVILEILAICKEGSLKKLGSLQFKAYPYYYANLHRLTDWIALVTSQTLHGRSGQIDAFRKPRRPPHSWPAL